MDTAGIGALLQREEQTILSKWVESQLGGGARRDLQSEVEVKRQSQEFLRTFVEAAKGGYDEDVASGSWDVVRSSLTSLSRSRAMAGFTPSETATFVFSLKEPVFSVLRKGLASEPQKLSEETWRSSQLLDKLGLITIDAYQQGREQVIRRQQQELLDLSTPVIKLWDGIVAVPLIGTLDSERTQVVMESLLEAIVDNEATVAIIDITGVPTVDTLVAQHLLKAVAAARLMGTDCIISGIRPQIAQTIVHLGVNLGDVVTKSTLADALRVALTRCGLAVGKAAAARGA